MTVSNIVLRALKEVVTVLEKENLDWCLFGGLAMQVYRRIRATKDIDLMLMIDKKQLSYFISYMEKNDFKFDKKTGIVKLNSFELIRFSHQDEITGLEIFIDIVTATTDFQKQILRRKRQQAFFDIPINIASCEDIILLKILANRPIDLMDAQDLIKENIKEIDKDYLRDWAKQLGVKKKLEGFIKATGE